MTKRLDVFTDGACSQFAASSGRGGWAAIAVFKGHVLSFKGAEENTTNNRMEMTAMLKILERLAKSPWPLDEVLVHSDSQYAIRMFDGTYKVKAKTANQDLIQRYRELEEALAAKGTKVRFQWVRGHSGHVYNEMADQLAESMLQGL
jgi:ribonuclease HI